MQMRSDRKSLKICPNSDKVLEGAMNISGPGRASRGGSCFKENVNMNKYESPKLAVEPLKMKRKGKGGGYNLRKSLAWDRAFFTEDGVLDSTELSIITGASCHEGLLSVKDDDYCSSPIHFEESADQQKFGKSSSKKFPSGDMDKRRDRGGLSRKDCASSLEHLMSTSTASPRVPSSADTESRSRSGECAVASSSLKRPANMNACKAALKELKLPKVPCYKPSFSPTGATSNSIMVRANSVKHDQVVQSDSDIQKNAGSTSSSRALTNSKNGSKAYSLRSTRLSDVNPGNSLIKRPSSVSTSKVLVDKANVSVAKTIPGNRRLSSAMQTHSSDNHDGIAVCAAPLPQASRVSGRTMQPLHNQTIKPSGLRMPSPSLSFFSRPKASPLQNLTQQKVGIDAFEPKRSGHLSFHGVQLTYKTDEKISEDTDNKKAVNSKAALLAPSHVGTFGLNNVKLEQDSLKKVKLKVFDDSRNLNPIRNTHLEDSRVSGELVQKLLRTDDRTDGKSHEETEVKKIHIKTASQGRGYEVVTGDQILKDGDNYTVTGESCGRALRNLELMSERNNDYESENKASLSESQSNCSYPILKDGGSIGTQDLETFHERGQNHRKETLKIDGCDPYTGQSEPSVDLPSVTGKGTDEVSCLSYRKDLTIEDGDSNKQSGDSSEIHQASLEAKMNSPIYFELNTGHHENSICEDNSSKKSNIEKFLLSPNAVSDSVASFERNSSLTIMKSNYDVDHISASSSAIMMGSGGRSQNNGTMISCELGTVLASDPANNFFPISDQMHRSHSAKIDCCGSSSIGQTPEVLEELIPRTSDGVRSLENNPEINISISTFSLKNSESDVAQNVHESVTMPVNCFLEHSELPNSESVCDDFVDGDDVLCPGNHHKMKRIDDGLRQVYESTVRAVDCFNEASESGERTVNGFIKVNESSNSDASDVEENNKDEGSFSTGELPLSPKSSIDAHENDDQSYGEWAKKDCSEIDPISDPIKTDVSECTDNSSHEFHPKLDNANVEADIAPKNDRDGPRQKASIVLPENVVPFSDEWLAAIEAAGEEILTRKSGAVQNSPPEKPLPEPSPWSPVKKKNNQIGPYDCTKYTNNLPSDS